jgi:uncharacterized membrane protein
MHSWQRDVHLDPLPGRGPGCLFTALALVSLTAWAHQARPRNTDAVLHYRVLAIFFL